MIDNIAEQIGSAVETMAMGGDSPPPHGGMQAPPPHGEQPPSLFEDDESVKLYTPGEETEEISPRPKFDFDDLKFGANFDSDD